MAKKMKKTRLMNGLLLGVLALSMWAPASFGAILPLQKMKSSRFWPGHWPETVIVTGNYAKPRLLAEWAQRETNLPIILISPEAGGDELYYMPAPPDARQIDRGKFVELIDVLLRPKRVIFLGDERYINESYKESIQGQYPTIVISGKDWVKNADELGRLVGVRDLETRFRNSLIKLLEAESHRGDFSAEPSEELLMPTIEEFEE